MKISFNWLKQYLNFDLSPEETGRYLTDCGLEVEGLEEFESVKGGLRGLVVGEVLTCEKHPDSDHLSITTVKTNHETVLNIVCGASNVAQGQKVIVAMVGATLYKGDEAFTIKKSKIRGITSEGMICAEDEIGVGNSHDGIMVLNPSAKVGTPAADFFQLPTDYIFEIGLTPNRSDAISHVGVARDLHAILKINNIPCSTLMLPNASEFNSYSQYKMDITIENSVACPRYTGLVLDHVTVKESPEWLQNRLKSIGIRPINNIVDITQFVMFELGQPMHAFDADKIKGNKVMIKNLPEGTPFVTLDGEEVKLSSEDLMICNAENGMCIAGVYGGRDSGVTQRTTAVFLESAYFNPVSVRKTSKRHSLKTDASFRYERGCDPEITVYAIKRAANLIKELAGADIVSDIMDVYPSEIERPKIRLHFDEINKIAGKQIEKQTVSNILLLLGMEIQTVDDEQMMVSIPLNKTDVTRPIDLIEEVLRIYGYNNIEIPDILTYPISAYTENSRNKIQKTVSLYLADNGFYEVMNNSLTKSDYAQNFDFIDENTTVLMLNPLSNELNAMRQTLLFSGLENIARNINNKNANLRIFEFGKTYHHQKNAVKEDDVTSKYIEREMLTLFVTGKTHEDVWNESAKELDLYYLKNIIRNILVKINFPVEKLTLSVEKTSLFLDHLIYKLGEKTLVRLGQLHPKVLKYVDIKKTVYYAEFDVSVLLSGCNNTAISYMPIPLYPFVKRDLALVIDQNIGYDKLEEIGYKYGSKLLKNISLFDVYEGDKIEAGKKSYALNFIIQHPDKTLTDEEINKVMSKLIAAYEREIGAQLR